MKVESQIILNKFKPRDYQLPLCSALENKHFKKILIVWPRRAGKDVVAWNLIIRQAIKRPGSYFYIFPKYSQARKVIWDALTIDGKRFIYEFLPDELVVSRNSQQMSIRLHNGSLIQLAGSKNIDSLMGTNPLGIVFSEYAMQDPQAYRYLRPILMANDGFSIFVSTPRAKNHFYQLYQIALHNAKEWFCEKLTLSDTKHISLQKLEEERRDEEMSEDLIQQEFYTSFDMGIEGSYYGKYIDKMNLDDRISDIPWEAAFKVHTAWDIGVRDSTTIIFFQAIGQTIRIIDCYENAKVGLEHYTQIISQKPYTYGTHIAPHDMRVREFGTGLTRLDKASQLGIDFIIAPQLSLQDGIECVRSTLSKIWIDQSKCSRFIKALENYRQEWDDLRKSYRGYPLHDWTSHWADAMRYLCLSLPSITSMQTSPEALDRRYKETVYGVQSNLPEFFRDDQLTY